MGENLNIANVSPVPMHLHLRVVQTRGSRGRFNELAISDCTNRRQKDDRRGKPRADRLRVI